MTGFCGPARTRLLTSQTAVAELRVEDVDQVRLLGTEHVQSGFDQGQIKPDVLFAPAFNR